MYSEDLEEEIELDEEYQFFKSEHTHILYDIKGWAQDALAGALGQEVGTRELSYSLVLEQARHLQGLLGGPLAGARMSGLPSPRRPLSPPCRPW